MQEAAKRCVFLTRDSYIVSVETGADSWCVHHSVSSPSSSPAQDTALSRR